MPLSCEIKERLTAKLERGSRHIYQLKHDWEKFSLGAYETSYVDDPGTGERIYRLAKTAEIPHYFPLIIGDAIQNLRNVLDHLTHHLVCIGENSPGPFEHVYFPIASDADKYRAAATRKKIKGMRQTAIDAIDSVEPYKDGAGEILWRLNELSNTDKHRLLIMVAGFNEYRSMLPSRRLDMVHNFLGADSSVAQDSGAFMTKAGNLKMELGDILASIPKAEVDEDMHFSFEMAFKEPLIRDAPVIETLTATESFIRDMIDRFDQLDIFQS